LIVLDSSAAVDLFAWRQHGSWVRTQIERDGDAHVPHLFDLEVVAAIRRLVTRGTVQPREAALAVDELSLMRLARYPHLSFISRIWELKNNVSPYDAVYVALAEALEAPLVTTDLRLARSPGLPVDVIAP
jgi:predicted nucleic acid-binding protein